MEPRGVKCPRDRSGVRGQAGELHGVLSKSSPNVPLGRFGIHAASRLHRIRLDNQQNGDERCGAGERQHQGHLTVHQADLLNLYPNTII
jgi:hypothetical protein